MREGIIVLLLSSVQIRILWVIVCQKLTHLFLESITNTNLLLGKRCSRTLVDFVTYFHCNKYSVTIRGSLFTPVTRCWTRTCTLKQLLPWGIRELPKINQSELQSFPCFYSEKKSSLFPTWNWELRSGQGYLLSFHCLF